MDGFNEVRICLLEAWLSQSQSPSIESVPRRMYCMYVLYCTECTICTHPRLNNQVPDTTATEIFPLSYGICRKQLWLCFRMHQSISYYAYGVRRAECGVYSSIYCVPIVQRSRHAFILSCTYCPPSPFLPSPDSSHPTAHTSYIGTHHGPASEHPYHMYGVHTCPYHAHHPHRAETLCTQPLSLPKFPSVFIRSAL